MAAYLAAITRSFNVLDFQKDKLAEGVRFELTEPFRVRQFSRLMP